MNEQYRQQQVAISKRTLREITHPSTNARVSKPEEEKPESPLVCHHDIIPVDPSPIMDQPESESADDEGLDTTFRTDLRHCRRRRNPVNHRKFLLYADPILDIPTAPRLGGPESRSSQSHEQRLGLETHRRSLERLHLRKRSNNPTEWQWDSRTRDQQSTDEQDVVLASVPELVLDEKDNSDSAENNNKSSEEQPLPSSMTPITRPKDNDDQDRLYHRIDAMWTDLGLSVESRLQLMEKYCTEPLALSQAVEVWEKVAATLVIQDKMTKVS